MILSNYPRLALYFL